MPLAVTDFTNSRREGRMLPPLGQRCCEHIRFEPQPRALDFVCPAASCSNSERSAVDSSKASNLYNIPDITNF